MPNDKSADDASSKHAAPTGHEGRVSVLQSASNTVDYVRNALSDKSIVLRDEDKTSSRVLSIFLIVGIAALLVGALQQDWNWLRARLGAGGFTPFRPINLIVLGAVDVLYFLPLCWFVARRMGILQTMSKRHAVISVQLMIGTSILTALVCVNVAVIVLLICLGNHMKVLVG